MELKYTPKVIEELEIELGKPVQDLLADYSITTIVAFVRKGLGIDKEKAYIEIDKYLAEGKDTIELYLLIMEKLQGAGFLPRQLNLKKIREDMAKGLEAV